ncbi:hypothetical protein RN001_005806 [Aquatica leii]|uniref:Uncharacterized protein n=1 Tax=Aquatica leii TaxID=1421715 RepID=A0AAN7Q1T0_9COLE|nr:hypothetical protein RN001_005806 [Aquatica leii]
MKTTVKRRARDVKYGVTGTGGGNPVKPLADTEEKLLALISNVSIEGTAIAEPGVAIEVPITANQEISNADEISKTTDSESTCETIKEDLNEGDSKYKRVR